MSTIEVGDLLYDYTVNLTGVTDYGVTLESLMAGAAPPPEGARFDVRFEGSSSGPKLKGTASGIDYIRVRADGRFELHIHAEMTTEDGHRIALFADGVGLPQPGSPIVQLRENATLFTCSKKYAWVNALQVWGTGTADMLQRVVHIKGYAA
jgi:hypothetical protein